VIDARLSDFMNPTERQRQAFTATDTHRFVLFGGAGGGGKSYFLRWWCLRQLLKLYVKTGIEGIRVGLFSMDYPTLTDRQISRISREFPAKLGSLKKTQTDGFNFQLFPEFGNGTIALRNLDDPSKYRSAEFAAIAIEELTENTKETFDDLRFRLRWPGIDRPCLIAATNPGGVGHHWVKEFWIDKKFPKEMQPLSKEFAYVPARVQDNPHLTGEYYQDLLSLPDRRRKALAEGDWSIPEGQYFTNWDRSRRAVHPGVMAQIVKPWWSRWISMDWGFRHVSAIYWFAAGDVMPEDAKLLGRDWDTPRRCVFTYRELVMSLAEAGNEVGSGEAELARLIADKTKEQCSSFFLSPDAFGQKQSSHPPAVIIGEEFRALNKSRSQYQMPQPDRAINDRVPGWRFMYSLIQNDSWFISEMCPEALSAVPSAQYDKDGPNTEDVQKTDHAYDDCIDSLRYGLFSMLRNTTKPFEVATREKVEQVLHDFGATQASITHTKILYDHKKKTERFRRQYT
jgi:phage terminase large subunit